MSYTNSSLVTYKKISPNRNSPRNHVIDRISIHCVVGQLTVEGIGSIFASASRQASSNYGVGTDGKIGMYVEEKDRSWCTSSGANDHRAVTIEVASDTKHPYAVNDTAYKALINLVVDICKRNGKNKVVWIPNKDKAIDYKPAANEILLTVHRWFANKACPGDYLYNRHQDIANKVNAILVGSAAPETVVTKPTTPKVDKTNVTATKAATEKNPSLAGTYKVTSEDGLNIRTGAGTGHRALIAIPDGTEVQNHGYYTPYLGHKWLYVQFTYCGVKYTGFVHEGYLKKI